MDINPFLEIEEKYNLYDDKIGEFSYWNYTRFLIWGEIINEKTEAVNTTKNMTNIDRLNFYLMILYWAVVGCIKKVKHHKVCVVSHPRRVYLQGKYECIYTDEIVRRFSDSIVLENQYQMSHMRPIPTKNLRYLDDMTLRKMILLRVGNLFFKKKALKTKGIIRDKVGNVLCDLEKAYSINIDKEKIVKIIYEHFVYYKATIKSLERLISRISPKIVVEVVSYALDCMMINEICKKKNITTVELQHGVMTDHLAYFYHTDKIIKQLPDKIFLFSDFWKEELHWPINKCNIVTTGYPYFEKKVKEAKKIEKYNDGKINIIFISQGTIGKKLSKMAENLSHILEKQEYRIFYKLHPAEYVVWEKEYECLKKSNIIVLKDNKVELYDYFATCQIQVGVYSTALYEGLGFGLKTYIYQIEMSDKMKKLSEVGYVDYFHSTEEILEYIGKTSKNIKELNFSNEFWKENAIDYVINNIKKELND